MNILGSIQIALLGVQFQWTGDMQSALAQAKNDKSIMSKAMKKTDTILKEMVTMTTKDLSKMDRTNLETCVTVHVHQRDTSEDLLKKKIKEPTDFEWLKQCRFYWREDKNTVIISICDVRSLHPACPHTSLNFSFFPRCLWGGAFPRLLYHRWLLSLTVSFPTFHPWPRRSTSSTRTSTSA